MIGFDRKPDTAGSVHWEVLVEYEKPKVTDYGSIAGQTFLGHSPVDVVDEPGDAT